MGSSWPARAERRVARSSPRPPARAGVPVDRLPAQSLSP